MNILALSVLIMKTVGNMSPFLLSKDLSKDSAICKMVVKHYKSFQNIAVNLICFYALGLYILNHAFQVYIIKGKVVAVILYFFMVKKMRAEMGAVGF